MWFTNNNFTLENPYFGHSVPYFWKEITERDLIIKENEKCQNHQIVARSSTRFRGVTFLLPTYPHVQIRKYFMSLKSVTAKCQLSISHSNSVRST